ncbi:MAG: polyprenol phosphomannose-dependent alpha 1,6 mannosyltransferase MptB [Actinobacteria bacterium]|nr:polyprenol phosphomannose-dependent alpha 1,6 mannosyltransferase MptB [Actinomycetota bacterium]
MREVLVACALWTLPLLFARPLFSKDVYLYAGQAVLDDPYTQGPSAHPGPLFDAVDSYWRDLPSLYGPLFLRLASLVVRVTGERPLAAAYGLRLLEVVGLVLVAWALRRSATALWLTVANPLLLLHGIAGGHNDLLMIGLVVAGLGAPLPVGAALITLGALVKAPALLALGFLPLLHGRSVRSYAVAAAVSVTTAVLGTLATGLGWGWTGNLSGGNALKSLLSVSTGFGVLIGSVPVGHAVGLALTGVLVLALLVAAPRIGVLRALGLAFLVVAVLSPVVQPWYLLWPLVVLAPVVGRRGLLALAAASAVLCLLVLPSGRHIIRPPLYGVPMLLVGATAYAASRMTPHGMGTPAASSAHLPTGPP